MKIDTEVPMPLPTSHCWCGCGSKASRGAFFAPGHDKRAESAVVKVIYGSVPQLLLAHGFGPDGRSASDALEEFQKNGGAYL